MVCEDLATEAVWPDIQENGRSHTETSGNVDEKEEDRRVPSEVGRLLGKRGNLGAFHREQNTHVPHRSILEQSGTEDVANSAKGKC